MTYHVNTHTTLHKNMEAAAPQVSVSIKLRPKGRIIRTSLRTIHYLVLCNLAGLAPLPLILHPPPFLPYLKFQARVNNSPARAVHQHPVIHTAILAQVLLVLTSKSMFLSAIHLRTTNMHRQQVNAIQRRRHHKVGVHTRL